eukprot:m.232727 g.232727  ORF g.232727 m.232727 type:complete len:87 (+) comp18887_c0_seq5:45-305(+)
MLRAGWLHARGRTKGQKGSFVKPATSQAHKDCMELVACCHLFLRFHITSPPSPQAPPIPFLIKVKTSDLAEELVEKLNKYKAGTDE